MLAGPLDDAVILDAAQADPVGFVSGRTGLVGVDEAQRVPELLLAVKAEVDRERRPGRFLLTGSTRLLGAPKLADSLAGAVRAARTAPATELLSRTPPSTRRGASAVNALLEERRAGR